MFVARRQRTLARPAVVSGFGYYSGCDIRLEFWPAPEDAGVTFVRHDLGVDARVRASVDLRIDVPRRTTLEANGVRVGMVEHVLAALSGLGIDNCEIWVDAEEMPGCDGSAREFVAAIDAAGIIEQRRPVRQIVVDRPIRVGGPEAWIAAQPARGAGLSVSFDLDFGTDNAIGRQQFAADITANVFRDELAHCRTFLLEADAQAMLAQGIGHRVSPRDLLIFGPRGPIDNSLRFADECVRHKVLDVVGDLALSGCEVVAHIVAYRSGHRLHAELARLLREQMNIETHQFGATGLRRCA